MFCLIIIAKKKKRRDYVKIKCNDSQQQATVAEVEVAASNASLKQLGSSLAQYALIVFHTHQRCHLVQHFHSKVNVSLCVARRDTKSGSRQDD